MYIYRDIQYISNYPHVYFDRSVQPMRTEIHMAQLWQEPSLWSIALT